MTRFGGIVGGIGRSPAPAGAAVQGRPFVTATDLARVLGSPTGDVRSLQPRFGVVPLTGGQQAWPLSLVRQRAVAQGLDGLAALDRLGPPRGGRYLSFADAARRLSTADEDAFLRAVKSGEVPTVMVQPIGSRTLLRMVPEGAVPPPAPASAAPAARAADAGDAPARVRPAAPEAGVGRSNGRRGLAMGAAIGGGVSAPMLLMSREGTRAAAEPSPDATGASTPGEPAVEEAAPEVATEANAQPTVAPSAPANPAAAAVAATRTRISELARSEVGTVEQHDPATGAITNEVARYFTSSTQAKPRHDWDWPGYFAAWVREQAGAPITPAGNDWKYLRELGDHAKATGTHRPPSHHPENGDVMFLFDGTRYSAGVVTGGDAGRVRIVEGWVLEGGSRRVVERAVDRSDPAITGYAVVPR